MFTMRERATTVATRDEEGKPRTNAASHRSRRRDEDDGGEEDEESEEDEDEDEESGEDEDFDPGSRRRSNARAAAGGGAVGKGNGAKGEDAPAVDASEFNIDADRERFKAGTLKREVFKMLEEAWPKIMDANELYEMGSANGVNVGKNKTVLASGLSHDKCFVRVPNTRNKWALRAHVGYPAGTKRKAEEDKPPRERKAKAPRVKGGFAGLLDTLEADEKASLLAWSDKLKQNCADLKKAKNAIEKAKNAVEKARTALEEFESNPPVELAAANVQAKSHEDILCEGDAPSDRLEKEFREYTGPDDRKFWSPGKSRSRLRRLASRRRKTFTSLSARKRSAKRRAS